MTTLEETVHQHRQAVYLFFQKLTEQGRTILLRSDIRERIELFCKTEAGAPLRNTPFDVAMRAAVEVVIQVPWVYFSIRPRIGEYQYLRFMIEGLLCAEVTPSEFLQFKERLVAGPGEADAWALEIDLEPFERGFPKLKEARSIGCGVEFLNRHLSSRLFDTPGKGEQYVFEFLRIHQYDGMQLLLNHQIATVEELRGALREASAFLETQRKGAEWGDVAERMRALGFEPGWGRSVSRVRETLELLRDLLEAPSPATIEKFLSRIPMVFSIVILSPHGYFGQGGVLGLPDTGGQIVYILDQVRALSQEMRRRMSDQGLDIQPQILIVTRLIPEAGNTTCNQRDERVLGTRNVRILRVPFRYASGEVVPHWIPRFRVWPFLERFSLEVEREVLSELGGRPDLIIGNYSDGNLVASLLSQRLGVTQCNIAHALEKTKYLLSALHWRDLDPDYHFSCQFSADLIAMNTADFIIASTYQEIAGDDETQGQYESYGTFTMPGLYRVIKGIDVFDPKFNILSPGADQNVYFPYHNKNRRLMELHPEVERLVHGEPDAASRGRLRDKRKALVFTMARLDRVKNITGFVEWYGRSERLRRCANLLVVGGYIDPGASRDHEERAQIERMHRLIDEYQLEDEVRWVGRRLDRDFAGELYRYVADLRGVFVQPALFEAFGLTVVEAMTCGLPTFATCHGGPREIIVHGVSGFHIDPNHGDLAAEEIAAFIEESQGDPSRWRHVSEEAMKRVRTRYTWKRYAERMMTLSRIYAFWKYVSNLERAETRRYLEMFYGLVYRKSAESVEV